MKVLVTGAAGRLGTEVCKALVGDGHAVRGVDRVFVREFPGEMVVADLLDEYASYQLIEGMDSVVHLANIPNQSVATPQVTLNQNIAVNMNVFEAARQLGVVNVVYASSIQVAYGHQDERGKSSDETFRMPYLPLDGNLPACPRQAYALSKHLAEVMLQYFCEAHGMNATAVRFPGLFDGRTLCTRWNPGSPLGRRREAYSFLPPADAGRLVAAIVGAGLKGYRVYLPAVRSVLGDRTLAQVVAEDFPGVPLKRPIEEMDSLVDCRQITADTGWVPGAE